MPKRIDRDAVLAVYAATEGRTPAERCRKAAVAAGVSIPTVVRLVKGRVAGVSSSHSPAGPTPVGVHPARVLPVGHPATVEARTLFPTTVRDVGRERVLKSGEHSAKLGAVITKGPWKGFPVFALTLEERATCPASCRHWSSCYGNRTHMAVRWRHGPDLEWRLRREVAAIELDHPDGFAVRLHNLGDFFSVGYVRMWRELLDAHAALHVFGYTARINTSQDEIAYELAMLVREHWVLAERPRFCVRFSNAPVGVRSTISLESPTQPAADGGPVLVCPAQWTPSGKKTESCSTCGLCWGTTRRIGFLQH